MRDLETRLAELKGLKDALSPGWAALSMWLIGQRKQYVETLIKANDERTRGRIMEIDKILSLPETLSLEITDIVSALSGDNPDADDDDGGLTDDWQRKLVDGPK